MKKVEAVFRPDRLEKSRVRRVIEEPPPLRQPRDEPGEGHLENVTNPRHCRQRGNPKRLAAAPFGRVLH